MVALLLAVALLQPVPDRRVAITFDDLPVNTLDTSLANHRAITAGLVGAIAESGVPAIGFVNEGKLYVEGRLVSEREGLLWSWLDRGLDLGNHGFDHLDLHRTGLAEYLADIARGERVTRRVLGARGRAPAYYRHPFLHTGRSIVARDSVVGFLASQGYQVAPVTIDNSEWIFARGYENVLRRGDSAEAGRIAREYLDYLNRTFDYFERQSVALFGREIPQVLLLHANRLNADHFGGVAKVIGARGYRFVSLTEAIADSAYRTADRYHGPAGITWLHRWAFSLGRRDAIVRDQPRTASFVMAAAGIREE